MPSAPVAPAALSRDPYPRRYRRVATGPEIGRAESLRWVAVLFMLGCGVVYGVQIMRSSMPLFIVMVVGDGPVTSKWILPVDCAPSRMVAPLILVGLATCHSTR